MEGFVTQPHNQVCFAFQLKMLKRKQEKKINLPNDRGWFP